MEIFPCRKGRVEGIFLRYNPYFIANLLGLSFIRESTYSEVSSSRLDPSHKNRHESRFPCPIGTQNTINFSFLHSKREVFQGEILRFFIFLIQMGYFYCFFYHIAEKFLSSSTEIPNILAYFLKVFSDKRANTLGLACLLIIHCHLFI